MVERVLAVALLIISPLGRIFCLEELRDKSQYEKRAGMISFPIETMEDGEGRERALERLLVEEVGTSPCLSDPVFFGEVDMEFVTGRESRIFCYAVFSPKEFVGNPIDTDIRFYGWVCFADFFEMEGAGRRKEVIPVLNQFLEY